MTVTKASLSEKLSTILGMSRHDGKAFVEEFFGEVIQSLSMGGAVKLSGFGNFMTFPTKDPNSTQSTSKESS